MNDLTMGVSPIQPIPATIWSRIVSSPRRLLMLDYDGTLAPFHSNRREATMSRRTRDALRAVALQGERVMVVSGRPAAELRDMLPGIPVDLVGEHGWEELRLSGERHVHPLPAATAARLGLAYRAAAACDWGARLETKRTSVVLHTRGLPEDVADRIEQSGRDLWRGFFERDGLQLEDINGGLELRAGQRDKGVAALEALAQQPEGTLPVFLGDDISDETAHAAIRPLGVTIRVGRPHVPTAAEWRFQTIDDVTQFLEQWRTVVPRQPRDP